MKIWIDLENSPHVLFFQPVIKELESRGHRLVISARNYAQTVGLAKYFKIPCKIIGKHGGKNRVKKVLNMLIRVWKLMKYVRKKDVDLAVSFNSSTQAIVSKVLRIPFVTLMDYEYQPANYLTFKLAQKVIVPKVFPNSIFKRYGINKGRIIRYNGLKEQVYLSGFKPDIFFLKKIGLSDKKVLVTVRPPASMALYHSFENPLFEKVLDYLSQKTSVTMIILPRTEEQRVMIENKRYKNTIVPEKPLDGKNLIYYSDLVISAGGTMNREAAVLGTPAYTIYKGRMGAVDKYLINEGKIIDLSKDENLDVIKLRKKRRMNNLGNDHLCEEIVSRILEIRT